MLWIQMKRSRVTPQRDGLQLHRFCWKSEAEQMAVSALYALDIDFLLFVLEHKHWRLLGVKLEQLSVEKSTRNQNPAVTKYMRIRVSEGLLCHHEHYAVHQTQIKEDFQRGQWRFGQRKISPNQALLSVQLISKTSSHASNVIDQGFCCTFLLISAHVST